MGLRSRAVRSSPQPPGNSSPFPASRPLRSNTRSVRLTGMAGFRWSQLAGSEDGLFETTRRVVGRGEYRGLTFHEIEARSILTKSPPGTPWFAYSINAYRGCSHACVYCLAGETPILMADGRTKPIASIRPGDRVYGTQRQGSHRRLVEAEVLNHWSTVKRAYRVTAGGDTVLVASGDHRFLTDRGW